MSLLKDFESWAGNQANAVTSKLKSAGEYLSSNVGLNRNALDFHGAGDRAGNYLTKSSNVALTPARYAQKAVVAPLTQGIANYQVSREQGKPLGWNTVTDSVLPVSQGLFNASPAGIAWNGRTAIATGALNAVRTGNYKGALTTTGNAFANQDSLAQVGLGMKPGVASTFVDLAAGNPRGSLAGAANLKNLKSIGNAMHNTATIGKSGLLASGIVNAKTDVFDDFKAIGKLGGKTGTKAVNAAEELFNRAEGAYAGYKQALRKQEITRNNIAKLFSAPEGLKTVSNNSKGKFQALTDEVPITSKVRADKFLRELESGKNISEINDPYGNIMNGEITITRDPRSMRIVSAKADDPLLQSYLSDSAAQNKFKSFDKYAARINSQKSSVAPDDISNLSLKGAQFRTSASGEKPFNVDGYVKELTQKQSTAAGSPSSVGFKGKATSLINDIKVKLVDSLAPIEDVIYDHTKKLPGGSDLSFSNQADRALRSNSLATQFVKDNGLENIIRTVDNPDAFNQYLIAKQAAYVDDFAKTGRDKVKDADLVAALQDKYEPLAQQVYRYGQNLLTYAEDSGLVSKQLGAELRRKYPEYVPLNRIFSESELGTMAAQGKPKAVASIGKQSVVQRLKGSEREIINPLESYLTKTLTAFEQGERNKAASTLVQVGSGLEGNPFGLSKVTGKKSPGDAAISVFENGKKVLYNATPEIAAAAKNLNQQQIGFLGKIFAVPTRVLKLGATGLNLPFVASNLAKDQLYGFINSKNALKTSLANPQTFMQSFAAVTKKNDLYDEWVRSGSAFNSFELSRDAAKQTVEKIRAGRSTASKIKYLAANPGEMLSAVEDMIGKTEELSRIAQYAGTKNAALKKGVDNASAIEQAARASRENTTNFARRGEWGVALNSAIPYFNAGIQGARQLVRTGSQNPKGLAAKLTVGVFTPIAYSTVWNLSDPERRAAYEDIPDYEKENNIIYIPPNPTKGEDGKWNVIKIPLTPGLSNIGSVVRRGIEGMNGLDGNSMSQIASDLFQAGTSLPLPTDADTGRQLVGQLTPQLIKPGIESVTNTNLYTGNKIVPDSMNDLPPEMQVKDTTAGGAKAIGGALGISPLVVENAARTIGGGVGSQLIGAQDPLAATSARFTKASGGQTENKVFGAIDSANREDAGKQATDKKQLELAAKNYLSLSLPERQKVITSLISSGALTKSNKDTFKKMVKDNKAGGLSSSEKYLRSQGTSVRARVIKQQIQQLPKGGARRAYLDGLIRKGIVTKDVYSQIITKQPTYAAN